MLALRKRSFLHSQFSANLIRASIEGRIYYYSRPVIIGRVLKMFSMEIVLTHKLDKLQSFIKTILESFGQSII